MSYRKLKADQLFTGAEMLGSDKILVVKVDGQVEEIINQDDAGEDVEILQGILSPGFINAHCHLELSHMKGLIPESTGLVNFVYKVVNDRQAGFAEEEICSAIESAENEMFANGIVAVGDICNNLLTLPQKLKKRLTYYNFIEASGWLPSVARPRFERALTLYNGFQSGNSSIVPHAPYSVSEELWNLITPYFHNKVVSIHNQETLFEDEFFLHGTGDLTRMYELMKIDNSHHQPTKKSSLQTYFSKLSGAASIILVHNTFITQGDIDFINHDITGGAKTFFCLCINANQHIENAVPPVAMMIENNCSIILGTDSNASNRGLNILDEMRTIQKNFPAVTLQTMLQWATSNGAKALQMNTTLGSFEKWKKPGVVLIENIEDLQLKNNSSVKRIL